MEYIFHIGMGKTGTTSLQSALSSSEGVLNEQSMIYLGRSVGQWCFGPGKRARSFRLGVQSAEEQVRLARKFHDRVVAKAASSDARTAILSNEGIGQSDAVPFMQTLMDLADVRMIGYVRDPAEWLPSAYKQWALRVKSTKGPIPSYADRAPSLLQKYAKFADWCRTFESHVTLRPYCKDVLTDFTESTGVHLAPSQTKRLVTSEDADLLLRATFNGRFDGTVLRKPFENAVEAARLPPAGIDDLVSRSFDFTGTRSLIEQNTGTFDYFRDTHGMDFTSDIPPDPAPSDPQRIRERLLDYLIEIQMQQARRIGDLELRLSKQAKGAD